MAPQLKRISLGGSIQNGEYLVIGRSAFPLVFVLAVGATRAGAQRLSDPLPVVVAPSRSFIPADTGLLGPSDQDHRYVGFYVGLGAGAALGVYAIAECSGRECAVHPVPFALLSMALFSIAGALIGGMLPK